MKVYLKGKKNLNLNLEKYRFILTHLITINMITYESGKHESKTL
jgi:hypothetical protein